MRTGWGSARDVFDHLCLPQVREILGQCSCPAQFPMIKVSEGKYKVGDSSALIFIRVGAKPASKASLKTRHLRQEHTHTHTPVHTLTWLIAQKAVVHVMIPWNHAVSAYGITCCSSRLSAARAPGILQSAPIAPSDVSVYTLRPSRIRPETVLSPL